jgi:hypothetical protein
MKRATVGKTSAVIIWVKLENEGDKFFLKKNAAT